MDKIDQGLQHVLNAVGQGYRRHIQCIHGPFMVSLSRKPNKLMLKALLGFFELAIAHLCTFSDICGRKSAE